MCLLFPTEELCVPSEHYENKISQTEKPMQYLQHSFNSKKFKHSFTTISHF